MNTGITGSFMTCFWGLLAVKIQREFIVVFFGLTPTKISNPMFCGICYFPGVPGSKIRLVIVPFKVIPTPFLFVYSCK